MNIYQRLERQAEALKKAYPAGTRILLIEMGSDDPRPIPPNTRGTVQVVDDMGTVHCNFDNGRRLGLVSEADCFRKLTEQEIAEENDSICVEETTEELLGEECSAGPVMGM